MRLTRGKESNVSRLYILEIIMEECEVPLYKVGKASSNSSKKRMLEIIGSYFDTYRVTPMVRIVRDRVCEDVFTKEAECHKRLKEFAYASEKAFSGHTEVFRCSKEDVIAVYEEVLYGVQVELSDDTVELQKS